MRYIIDKLKLLYKEQPLIFFSLIVVLALIVFLAFVNRPGEPLTIGDQASKTSDAFLVYKESPFIPTGNTISDQQIREDMAFYARKQYPVYNPDKNPAVLFNIKEFTKNEQGRRSFSGKFDKHKSEISVSIELLQNDRVKVSITSKDDPVIDETLPSASPKNKFIASLPLSTANYSIDYSSEADTFQVTVFDTLETSAIEAKNELKKNLANEYSEESVSIIYPTYLKGEPQYYN